MKRTIIFILLTTIAINVSAVVKPASIFTNHMVLQQQSNVPLWGWAKPNAQVKVYTSWNKKWYTTLTDTNGKFRLKVSTTTAGGPYKI